jgi:TonB family protein
MTSAHTKLRLLCGILFAAAMSSAQDTKDAPAPAGPYKVGNGISPPRLRFKVEPEYSQEARRSRLEGTVMLRIVVGTDGKARDLRVLRSLGLGLDENAIAAVSNWQFEPGVKDGQPVNVIAQIEVNFRLGNNASRWRTVRADFHLPSGASRPVIEKGASPRVSDDAVSAKATGRPSISTKKAKSSTFNIDRASDDEWGRDVTAALRKWKFMPASKDGNPVSASCTMEFVRGTI